MLTTIQGKPAQLPTIHGVYQPVEAYGERHAHGIDPEDLLPPLDAFLIHLMLNFLPARPTVVDLAADSTRGLTTVLGLTHPRVRKVLMGEDEGTDGYRSALEQFVAEYEPALDAVLEPLPIRTGAREWQSIGSVRDKRSGHVFFLRAGDQAIEPLASTMRECLAVDPNGLVLILNLGQVGECEAVRTLLDVCGSDNGPRLWLLRELADGLRSSRLGLIASRENRMAEEVLKRLRRMYTSNFDFLHLVKKACLDAIKAADVDEAALKAHPTGWLVENREAVARLEHALNEVRSEVVFLKNDLSAAQYEAANLRGAWEQCGVACETMQALRWELCQRDQALAAIQGSLTYRLASRLARLRRWLAPEGSWRFRAYRKFRRVLALGRRPA